MTTAMVALLSPIVLPPIAGWISSHGRPAERTWSRLWFGTTE